MRFSVNPIIFIICAISYHNANAGLPKDIKKCRSGDDDCIARYLSKLLKDYPQGNPEIGLRSLAAIPYKGYIQNISQLNSSVVIYLNVKLKGQTSYGFENVTLTRIKGFRNNSKISSFTVYGHIPRFLLIGKYEIEGRFVFPIIGGGRSQFQNLRFVIKLKVHRLYRKNETYIEIFEAIPALDMDRMVIDFDNLYPDNSDLTIVVNKILNENWRDVYNDVEMSVLNFAADLIKDVFNPVFRIIPLSQFFL